MDNGLSVLKKDGLLEKVGRLFRFLDELSLWFSKIEKLINTKD